MSSKHLLSQAQSMGLVSDSLETRKNLLSQKDKSLENIKKELKIIIKEGYKKGQLSREDFFKKTIDLDAAHKRLIELRFENLNDNIALKNNAIKKQKI